MQGQAGKAILEIAVCITSLYALSIMNNRQFSTLKKLSLLNWLYLTDREVSVEKLGEFINKKTDGQYSITKNQQTFFSSQAMNEKKQEIA